MHVYIKTMRTTIEIPDNLHIRLIEEAARTGQRGFSAIVEKAIELYFLKGKESSTRKQIIHSLYGSMSENNSIDTETTRQNWKTGKSVSGTISENNS